MPATRKKTAKSDTKVFRIAAKRESKIYKMSELVGTSDISFSDATQAAIARAAKTLRNMDWFEVVEMRGAVSQGAITQYQVKLKIGFRLD